MSRTVWNNAAWVLLAAGVAVLNSAEPAGRLCSIADLDGDCDVDFGDFAVMQNAFTGPRDAAFDVIGTWDVFIFRPDAPDQPNYVSLGPWSFYGNGVVLLSGAGYRLFETNGAEVAVDYPFNECGAPPTAPLVLRFVEANILESDTFFFAPWPTNCGHFYYRALRRP